MTGKFDKPLGVSAPGAGKRTGLLRISAIAAVVLAVGAIGFGAMGYLAPDPIESKNSEQEIVSTDTITTPAEPENTQFAKRPDLPVDTDAPGLQELGVNANENIVPVVPRKRPKNTGSRQVLAYLPDNNLVEKSASGLLPVVSSAGQRPLDVYSRQPDTEGNFGVARIIIIVGGLGISQTSTEQAIRVLPAGVTLAFAPYGNSLKRWMQAARKGGHELLMQIPMEPFGYPQSSAGKRSLLSSVEDKLNITNLNWSLGRITNYVGVMNFLGGKMLTSPDSLVPVLDEISARGLMFVDDGSIRNSMAQKISKSVKLPFVRATMTIDTLRTRTAIRKKLEELEAIAKRTGIAIGVASAFPDSIAQIARFLKNAEKRGLELTPVSAIASVPGN
ncbi:MAG: divergent polysaccharide deacetylase family protein [Rhizobiaceae bacterium]|nr:divergent polysaccharide deacetylase family protein [Rhizobiaceae bacterium]